MKLFRFIRTLSLIVLICSIVVINFYGCSQDSSLNAVQDDSDLNLGILAKRIKTTSTSTTISGNYPQFGSCDPKYFAQWNAYNGDLINIPNGSQFSFLYGALTPPAGSAMGSKITITMQVDKDEINQQLVYTFSPSGCVFNPVATIWLSFKDLSGSGVPNLYMIDANGNYNPQVPEEIDILGQRLKISVHHFSRYAVAFSQ